MAPSVAWLVVGSRGLLGSAVVRELVLRGQTPTTVAVPWHDQSAAVEALVEAGRSVIRTGRPWRVVWCAGAGVVGTTAEALAVEVSTLEAFLTALLGDIPVGRSRGGIFLASSAGGVYAGSSNPPFTEQTEPRPISPYGEAKLSAERHLAAFAEKSGVPVLIGRIANLYGPGQDMTKAQGLISQLCGAHFARRPTSIYVSLDTSRDFLFADDAARLAIAGVERAAAQGRGSVTVKVLASQRGTTIAMILGELRRLTKRAPRVVFGASPLTRFQTRDLRFRSLVWPDLAKLVTTSLPAGMSATIAAIGRDARSGDNRAAR